MKPDGSNTLSLDLTSHHLLNGSRLGIQQPNAPDDLRIVSFPQGDKFPQPPTPLPPYTYNDGIGQETFVYVVDQGVNIQNTVGFRLLS